MSEFILMLTRHDVTVADAEELLDEVLQTQIGHVGFKDVGLGKEGMTRLVERLHAAGRTAHLEVVSLSEEEELRSAELGVELGVDYLIGGTRWQRVSEVVAGEPVRYFPYPGGIEGHPARLTGSVAEILADAEEMAGAVDGINLLAYRHIELDGTELTREVCEKASLPVIVAGSIDSLARVRAVSGAGAWAFTIGRAALDWELSPDRSLRDQIQATMQAAGAAKAVRP
ncbi:MAG TPA: hypothetical protein VMT37_02625 [Solirubrobacterales bacterium]|nr:hypothetical protein [Solirubrobacterales bacterium]